MARKFIECRQLSPYTLRKLCVKHNWYTNGDNEDYENLLHNLAKGNITTEALAEIADDIMRHSDSMSMRGYVLSDVMALIATICTHIFIEV